MRHLKYLFLFLCCIGASLTPVRAQFSGSGSGTSADPYLIFNPIQLNEVRNFLNNKDVYFKLMYDVDLTDWLADNNPSQGWQPIGNASAAFKGHFLGNGHKVKGFFINRLSTEYVGFFGFIDGAEVSGLAISGQQVAGNQYTGGLVGKSNSSTISNCSVTLDVRGCTQTGGLVGYAPGTTMTGDRYRGTVTLITGEKTGGLAGAASGSITGCRVDVTVKGSDRTGGLVGYIDGDMTISGSQFGGDITGQNYVGGILGNADDKITTITGSHCVGNVTASGINVGGLVGQISRGGVSDCYAIGDVTGVDQVGGLVGNLLEKNQDHPLNDIYFTTTIENSYYNGSVAGTGHDVGGIVGLLNSKYSIYYYRTYKGYSQVLKCYSHATVSGAYNVGGIVGNVSASNETTATIKSNVAIVETVNAKESNEGRIYGCATGNVVIGANGTAEENKGLSTAHLTLNGILQDVPDNLQHGTNVGMATLRLRATYQGIGWDFSNWKILETESFPYKADQCAPPVVTGGLTAGATVVSGKSANGGTVHLDVGGKHYSAVTSANTWSIVVDALQAGDVVKAYAVSGELGQSYIAKQNVTFKGKGTQAEPYEIYTAADLAKINSYSYYKLMNDIDLSQWIAQNSPTQGWVPIGLEGGGTMRQLDGDGHKITGLWSNTQSGFCGLISSTQDATVCNLTVHTASGRQLKGISNVGTIVGKAVNTTFSNITVACTVIGSENVGGIVGIAENSSLSSCSVEGTISGQSNIGGVMGQGQGSPITACKMSGTVTGTDNVGGLAGITSGNINSSHADATVTASNYAGGLVGELSGTMTECYSTGTTSATHNTACYAGGIAGVNRGTISDCYSSVEVHSGVVDGSIASSSLQQYAGGIAGYSYGTIERCFASANLFAVKFAAGIVGYNDGPDAVTRNCFAINEKIDVNNETGIALRVIGGIRNNAPTPGSDNYALKTMIVSVNNVTQKIYDDLLHGMSMTLDALKQGDTYAGNGWDMESVWGIDEENGFPFLRVSEQTNTPVATDLALEDGISIFKGESHAIQVSILPNTASTNLNWTSSDESVATVNADGVVTGVSAGQATITAVTTDGSNLTAQCVITVKDHAVSAAAITLDRESVVMSLNQELTLSATVLPENADNRGVVWNSTDATVATVDNQGTVTAKNVGTTQIIATTADGTNLTATCTVTVIEAAANGLAVDALTCQRGGTLVMPVELNNEDQISAVQADIYLPDGFSFITDEDDDYVLTLNDNRKSNNHTISAQLQPNGALRVLIASQTSKALKGNEGELFTVSIAVAGDLEGGDYNVVLRNITMSTPTATRFVAPDVNADIYVLAVAPGDVNGDGFVDVADYVSVANYILGLNPDPFYYAAADLDENNEIDVADLVGVANLVLGTNSPMPHKAPAVLHNDDFMTASMDGDVMNVTLHNAERYSAMQMDLTLPAGVTLADVRLSNRAHSRHSLATNAVAENTTRILVSSIQNDEFAGNDGVLLTLQLNGATSLDDAQAILHNIVLARTDAGRQKLPMLSVPMTTITHVADLKSTAEIRVSNGMLVIESAAAGVAQVVLPNGMVLPVNVVAGENVVPLAVQGVVIVRTQGKTVKVRL